MTNRSRYPGVYSGRVHFDVCFHVSSYGDYEEALRQVLIDLIDGTEWDDSQVGPDEAVWESEWSDAYEDRRLDLP